MIRFLAYFLSSIVLFAQLPNLLGQDVSAFVVDVSNMADGTISQARLEAERQAESGGLPFRSYRRGEYRRFTGEYTPPELPEEKKDRFIYGLALFSDDGCSVTLKDSSVHSRLGRNQHLPKLGESFHVLPVALAPGKSVEITVDYLNTIYFVDPKQPPDIDGFTLFLYLIPVEIAVDANRDGDIVFEGESRDTTSRETPFRFWINDDHDGTPNDEREVVPATEEDHADATIQTMRDLEDFARLHINIGGLQGSIANGDIHVGLEWRNVQSGGVPSIRVYQAAEVDGGQQYLNTQIGAANQQMGTFGTALGTVSVGGSFKFPASFWQSNLMGLPAFDADNPNRYLLFEGVTEGKGQLVLTFWKGTTQIGEGGACWLHIKDVRKMYERVYSQESIAWIKPSDYNPYQAPIVGIAPLDQIAFEKPQDETKETIVLVHGIHAIDIFTEDKAINTNTNMASTAFKRLWWQGFKGRFGFYKWEAHNLSQFNESEYRAWKCGRGLALFLNQLPGDRKHVWTFSQGATVGCAAIRDYGATPNTLIVMQAAAPAGVFDDSPSLNVYPSNPLKPREVYPDSVSELGYRGYLGSGVSGVSIINFADPSDDATGALWGASQNLKWEPHYAYDPSAPTGQRHTVTYTFSVGRFVTDLHESLPMIAHSQSQTIAHEPGASGAVADRVRLDTRFGFNNEHGAAFDRAIQDNLNDFYDEVLLQCGIPFNP